MVPFFSKWPQGKNSSLLGASSSTKSFNVVNHKDYALSPFFIYTFAAYVISFTAIASMTLCDNLSRPQTTLVS